MLDAGTPAPYPADVRRSSAYVVVPVLGLVVVAAAGAVALAGPAVPEVVVVAVPTTTLAPSRALPPDAGIPGIDPVPPPPPSTNPARPQGMVEVAVRVPEGPVDGLRPDEAVPRVTLPRFTPDPDAPPAPPDSGTGRRVVYAMGQQRVWAIEVDGTIVKSHRVSGRIGNPRLGTYEVWSRDRWSGIGATSWEFMIRFAIGTNGGNIGFHSIPIKHGKPLQSQSQLGQPLSAGCVRQARDDALWMWGWATIGTTVVVVR